MREMIFFLAILLFGNIAIGFVGNDYATYYHEQKHKHLFAYAGIDSTISMDWFGNGSETIPNATDYNVSNQTYRDLMLAQMIVEATDQPQLLPIIQTQLLFSIVVLLIWQWCNKC